MVPQLIMFGVLIVVAIGLVAYSIWPRRAGDREVLKRRLSGKSVAEDPTAIREQARKASSDAFVRKAAPVISRLVMPTSEVDQTNVRTKLVMAGLRQPNAQLLFMASKTVASVLGLILGVTIAVLMNKPMMLTIGFAAFGAGLGLVGPELWLSMAVGGRKEKVKHGLPDTLDLLVVSVESGLALDAALKRVGDEMAPVHPELSEELRIATMESQMGVPRGESLENMARRCGIDEMRALVSVILQAEKFGTSIARALRNQAETLRTKRRQAAEERAQKTAVKLMIPLVIFIFPAMGVVLGGPALLNILKALKENSVPGLS